MYGGSGGAGLGYGLPAALGVTLAHRGSGKVCVNLQSDGDLLYVVSGLYTAAHHRLPLLTVMFNNRTYGNDEAHQETVAKTRGRPVENKVVGIRIDDPAPDFARIAQGFGVHAEGPIDTAGAVGPALRRARPGRGPPAGPLPAGPVGQPLSSRFERVVRRGRVREHRCPGRRPVVPPPTGARHMREQTARPCGHMLSASLPTLDS